MALSVNVMNGAHVSAMSAQAINGNTVNAAVSTAGTTLATATALKADVNVITTASAGQGVSLYSMMPGDSQVVYNSTSTAFNVYPASTTVAINQLSVGKAFTLAPYTAVECICVSATQVVGILSD